MCWMRRVLSLSDNQRSFHKGGTLIDTTGKSTITDYVNDKATLKLH